MTNIEDIVLYENESTSVDFKAIEYAKEKYVDLLKDVISMANADTKEDRFIIVGVKHNPDGTRNIIGVSQLTDSAIIQQLVNENIEPEVDIDYFPYTIDEKTVGILKITNCLNQPYLVKKDYNSGGKHLQKGDGYIRKGTFQRRITRIDYDRIYEAKQNERYYQGDIEIVLKIESEKNTSILNKIGEIEFPSDIQKEKIEKILSQKKKEADLYNSLGSQFNPENFNLRRTMALSQGYGISYEDYTIDELEKELLNIKNIYYEKDYYYIFEKKSNKVNFSINNYGSKYIEDATLLLIFPKIEGVMISPKIPLQSNNSKIEMNPNLYYPDVLEKESSIHIESNIGDIKHGLSTDAFKENLRISIANRVEISEFEIECQLYGKNIKDFISKKIKIMIQSGN